MKWLLGVAVGSVLVVAHGGDDSSAEPELDPVSNGATLNTSTWPHVPEWENLLVMEMRVSGVVRVDANGCVYLEGKRPEVVSNVLWPAEHIASPQPDGTVTILNEDGVVVATTGHRLIASGGGLPPNFDVDWACSAEGANQPIVMITDWLPPLYD
jgi:hypothetical protein